MNSTFGKLAPVLILIVIVGGFMTADKLWLHWYTPDPKNSSGQIAQSQSTASPRPSATDNAQPAATSTEPGTRALTPIARPSSNPTAQRAADRDAFAALWLVGQRATYRARYETSSEDGEQGDAYVIFNMPPSARVDTIPQGATAPSLQIALDSSGKTTTCSTDGGSRDCVEAMGFSAPLPLSAGPIVFPAASTFGELDISEVDGRVVANAAARCFSIGASPPDVEQLDYCFSSTGVPLYARGPSGVTEATELSTTVADTDFLLSP